MTGATDNNARYGPARLVLENDGCPPRSFRSRFLLRGGNGNGPTIAVANDGAGRDEAHESIAEPFVADAELRAELCAAEGTVGASKRVEYEGIEIARRVVVGGRIARDKGEVYDGIVAGDELKA